MKSNNTTEQTAARESGGLQAGTLPPQGTSRTCNKGASSCNTAPHSYKNKKITTPLRKAIDSLYLTYKGTITFAIDDQLEQLKRIAGNKTPYPTSDAVFQVNDHRFEVKPSGTRNFAYILRDNWYYIKIASGNAKTMPLASVQISSQLLTFQPLQKILEDLDQIVLVLCGQKVKPSVSRMDLCFDLFSKQFSFDDVSDREWVTQANQINSFLIHNQRSGFQFGKSGMACRIYDKTREIKEQSQKFYLYDLWKDQGWDGETPVWRVEFEFQTEVLKQLKLREVENAVSSQNELWSAVTQHWLKLVIVNAADSNRSRWETHPVWLEIQQATSQGAEPIIKEVPTAQLPSSKTLFVNGLGYLVSFMASRKIRDIDKGVQQFMVEAEKFYALKGHKLSKVMSEKIKERAKRFNIPLEELDYD